MTEQFHGFKIRPAKMADAPAVLELVVACDMAEYGEPDTEIEEITSEWEELDLEKDAWLVYTPGEKLVGYAMVADNESRFGLEIFTHPDHEDKELNSQLLARCEARAREMIKDNPDLDEKEAGIYIARVNHKTQKALEKAGFKVIKHYYRMQKITETDLPEPIWPEGSALRAMSMEEDGRIAHKFIYKVFDWPGRGEPPSFESWSKFMMRPDHYHPDLWYLLELEGKIIGAALCFTYPETGWVRQIGVDRDWRKNGIGEALLNHVYSVFYEIGQPKVSLVVDSGNPGAFEFYKKAGMFIARQHDEFTKMIRE